MPASSEVNLSEIVLTPGRATLADLEQIWRQGLAVRLDESARGPIAAAAARIAAVRVRDRARLERQLEEGIFSGAEVFSGHKVEPEPLTQPEKPARPLNPEAQDILSHETEFSG